MPKHRKMLTDWRAPYIWPLMKLIETQSKHTIAAWCVAYAEENILPIYEKDYLDDARPRKALAAAKSWMEGEIKLPEAKRFILDCHAAAREAEHTPAAQAAARAIGQTASVIHMPAHSLGLALYGGLAVAYDRAGMGEAWAVYEQIAAEECVKMHDALCAVAVENEPCPAKINWNC